jgi:hypothetical protein
VPDDPIDRLSRSYATGPAAQIQWGRDHIRQEYGDPPSPGDPEHLGRGFPPPVPAGVSRTVTVGPFSVFYTNVNRPMGLRAHSHLAHIWVTYDTIGRHGYPSFEETNNDLHDRIRELTDHPFRDATNEDAADRLFTHLDGWVSESWVRWGGGYQLRSVRFDVVGVRDALGHDASTTTYTVSR